MQEYETGEMAMGEQELAGNRCQGEHFAKTLLSR